MFPLGILALLEPRPVVAVVTRAVKASRTLSRRPTTGRTPVGRCDFHERCAGARLRRDGLVSRSELVAT
jgi:hypothetical protein